MAHKLDKRTEEQKKALDTAIKTGALRDLAIARGGTGYLRKELTEKERLRRKNKRNQAKLSRKRNR